MLFEKILSLRQELHALNNLNSKCMEDLTQVTLDSRVLSEELNALKDTHETLYTERCRLNAELDRVCQMMNEHKRLQHNARSLQFVDKGFWDSSPPSTTKLYNKSLSTPRTSSPSPSRKQVYIPQVIRHQPTFKV
eukprot:PhF_6_TR32857/c0_g1_i1/m.48356